MDPTANREDQNTESRHCRTSRPEVDRRFLSEEKNRNRSPSSVVGKESEFPQKSAGGEGHQKKKNHQNPKGRGEGIDVLNSKGQKFVITTPPALNRSSG